MLTTFASVATVAFPLSRRVNTKVTRSLPMPVVMARNRTGYRRQVDCDLSVTWRTVVCKSAFLASCWFWKKNKIFDCLDGLSPEAIQLYGWSNGILLPM